MDVVTVILVIFRWTHILAAITAVGGAIFARLALLPAVSSLPEDQRAYLAEAVRVRWSKVVMASIGLLLLSGLFNIGYVSIVYQLPKFYMPLFMVKFVLAFAIFMIASLLVGRSELAQRVRRNGRVWLNVNIALAVILVCISGVLKVADHQPKENPQPAAASPP